MYFNAARHVEAFSQVEQASTTVILAGHYAAAEHMQELANTAAAEIMSFKLGCELIDYAQAAGRGALLVLMVNDIGMSLQERAALKGSDGIPDNYRAILDEHRLQSDAVEVLYESTLRNRASTRLRELYKRCPSLFERVSASDDRLVRCVGSTSCMAEQSNKTAYVVRGPDDLRLVVKEGPNPKCNLILATLFNDIRTRFDPSLIVNIFNEVYEYRLRLGQYVAEYLYNVKIPMLTVLCDGLEPDAG